MAARLTEEEKLERKRQREAEALAKRAEAKRAKIEEAEQGKCDLPALVLRDGTVLPLTLEQCVPMIKPFLDDLFIDVEHTGYQLGHKNYELRTVQMGGETAAVVFDAADPVQMALVAHCLKHARRLYAYSASADLNPLIHAGCIDWDSAWGKMYDGVLYSKLTDPAMSKSDADDLKNLAHDVLGDYAVSKPAEKDKNALFSAMGCLLKTTVTTPLDRSGWAQVDKRSVVMIRYAGSDVLDLAAVVRVLKGALPVTEAVLDRERKAEEICARISYEGFPLDLEHIREKIAEYEQKMTYARAVVEVLTDGRIKNPSSSAKEVLPTLTEMGYQLKEDRKTKRPSAGKASLEPIAAKGDILTKNILEYRHCVTTLGLLLRNLENLCTEGDGRMRPTVYTIEAQTGRMSCVRPNGQQFSRQGGIRSCVRIGKEDIELVNGQWVIAHAY